MQAQMSDRADLRRARPEYRKPRPGTMSSTMAEATMMKAMSPWMNHWFTFSDPA